MTTDAHITISSPPSDLVQSAPQWVPIYQKDHLKFRVAMHGSVGGLYEQHIR